MWISGGDHELTREHRPLVLAKIPGGPAGVKGISLFIVPKFLVGDDGSRRAQRRRAGRAQPQDGLPRHDQHPAQFRRGRCTAGRQAGAVGYLVGEPHRGLAYMFHMMNEARIGVGLGAVALGYTGYLQVAGLRAQPAAGPAAGGQGPGDAAGADHRARRRAADAAGAEVLRRRRAGAGLYCARLVDEQQHRRIAEERGRATLLLDILTPIAKSWPSQWCLEANDLAIQVHGGYGYTREYDVEQLYRDNRLNPIHEGTHGIQGLDLLGRKVVHARRRRPAELGKVDRPRLSPGPRRPAASAAELAAQLDSGLARLVAVTAGMFGTGDSEAALANARSTSRRSGTSSSPGSGWSSCSPRTASDGDFYDGKRAGRAVLLPLRAAQDRPQLDLLASLDRTTLNMRDAWF